ncbi:FliM/FliN family flagellar motor switch protein [Sulfurihydrogenibium sp.]|jgi:flagellar motor switch protein FliM|uniref:flagellar motor switch protein FliM n=1 Tax=Sulfurihydrogenibium sp. TaxID=2053621 RepID=UPI0026197B53|nr:FliM/FliN family flagellar motor switch protein [Sulfurihydrogenibium sp.]
MSDFLSQDEIDALIGGVKSSAAAEEKIKEKPFDFNRLEKIQKGGFQGLEVLFEKWVKIFREEIRAEFPVVNMVSKGKIVTMRFGDFIGKIPLPASYTIFNMKPLKDPSLLIIDSRVVFNLVSALFGGGARPFKIEGREFTKLEIRIIEKLVDIVLGSFEKIWKDVYPIEIERKSIEFNPFLVRIVSHAEKVIVAEIMIDIEGLEVPLIFAFPQMLFLPIKDILFTDTFGSKVSPEWRKELIKKLLKVNLKLTLELDKFSVLVKEFLNYDVGTEIILNKKQSDELDLKVEDKVKFKASLGKLDKKFAAMITEVIKENGDGGNG